MKLFRLWLVLLLVLFGAGCKQWFRGDDPVGPPSLDVTYMGSVSRPGGALYTQWRLVITFTGRGNDQYESYLANTGEFRIPAAWGPSETHSVTIYGAPIGGGVGDPVPNIVFYSTDIPWEAWGTAQWKYDFIVE